MAFSQIKEAQAGKYTLSVISRTSNYTVVMPVLIQSKYISIGSRGEAQVQSKEALMCCISAFSQIFIRLGAVFRGWSQNHRLRNSQLSLVNKPCKWKKRDVNEAHFSFMRDAPCSKRDKSRVAFVCSQSSQSRFVCLHLVYSWCCQLGCYLDQIRISLLF